MKLIIDNQSDATHLTAMNMVNSVIRNGRVSNYNKQYCYVTIFDLSAGKFVVYASLNKKSDKFLIRNSKHHG